jgi:hypothetical protein
MELLIKAITTHLSKTEKAKMKGGLNLMTPSSESLIPEIFLKKHSVEKTKVLIWMICKIKMDRWTLQ